MQPGSGEPEVELVRFVKRYEARRLLERAEPLVSQGRDFKALFDFFVTEVYAAPSTTKGRKELESYTGLFNAVLGRTLSSGIRELLALYDFTEQLDLRVAKELERAGVGLSFTGEEYEEAYRRATSYQERIDQLDQTIKCIRFAHRMSHLPFANSILKMASRTAGLYSATELFTFLNRAQQTFAKIRDVEPFLRELRKHTLAELNRMYRVNHQTSQLS